MNLKISYMYSFTLFNKVSVLMTFSGNACCKVLKAHKIQIPFYAYPSVPYFFIYDQHATFVNPVCALHKLCILINYSITINLYKLHVIVMVVIVMKNVTLYKVSRVVIQLITVEQCEE